MRQKMVVYLFYCDQLCCFRLKPMQTTITQSHYRSNRECYVQSARECMAQSLPTTPANWSGFSFVRKLPCTNTVLLPGFIVEQDAEQLEFVRAEQQELDSIPHTVRVLLNRPTVVSVSPIRVRIPIFNENQRPFAGRRPNRAAALSRRNKICTDGFGPSRVEILGCRLQKVEGRNWRAPKCICRGNVKLFFCCSCVGFDV